MSNIAGVHPYADEFPMASEDEINGLSESIAAVGLIHAIVITPDGLVLDGRNRIEACKRAGQDIHTEVREGTDDDYKEFVIGVNTTGRRESMTVQIAASSVALILGSERRKDGRWDNPGGRGKRGRLGGTLWQTFKKRQKGARAGIGPAAPCSSPHPEVWSSQAHTNTQCDPRPGYVGNNSMTQHTARRKETILPQRK
jgi:hypothetical protein